MEALKERFNKVMNRIETCKKFIDHVGNSIRQTIYMVDHCRSELMSWEINLHNGISREAIYNMNTAQSDVDEVNDALEVNAEVLPLLRVKLLGFSSHDPTRD